MRSWNGIAALAIVIASSLPAQAAPPKVSGKYALLGFAMCTARLSNGSGGVAAQEDGPIAVLNGYITFTPSSATTGDAEMATTRIRGESVTVDAPAHWRQTQLNQSGPYTLHNTTLDFADQTWIVSYADIVGGIAKTINMSRREDSPNPDCVDGLTLTRKQ